MKTETALLVLAVGVVAYLALQKAPAAVQDHAPAASAAPAVQGGNLWGSIGNVIDQLWAVGNQPAQTGPRTT